LKCNGNNYYSVLFYLLRKNTQHADGHISDSLNSVYNLSERVKTEKNL